MNKKLIEDVMAWAGEADEADIMLSRRNCHLELVDSIVVGRRPDGGLIRVFVAYPGSALEGNGERGEFAVGIHSHRYPIRLQGLRGTSRNLCFALCHDGECDLGAYKFTTAIGQGPVLEPDGRRRARCVSDVLIEDIELPHDELHTIRVIPSYSPVCWLVSEGVQVTERTFLLTDKAMAEWSADGLYEPFKDRNDVINTLSEAIGAA